MTYAYIAMREYSDPDGELTQSFHGAHATAIGAWKIAANGSDLSYHGGHDTAINAFIEKWELSTGALVASFSPEENAAIVAAQNDFQVTVDALKSGVSDYITNDPATQDAQNAWRAIETAMRADPAYAAALQAEQDAEEIDRNNDKKWKTGAEYVDTYGALQRARAATYAIRSALADAQGWYDARAAYQKANDDARIAYQDTVYAPGYAAARATFNAAVFAAVEIALSTF